MFKVKQYQSKKFLMSLTEKLLWVEVVSPLSTEEPKEATFLP